MPAGRKQHFCAYHVGQSGSIRSTEMVEAENLDLVPDVTDFQDVSGRKSRISFAVSWSRAEAVKSWR